jgi:hypothetical protein
MNRMAPSDALIETARQYLSASEAGASLSSFFTPDVVQQELPNVITIALNTFSAPRAAGS